MKKNQQVKEGGWQVWLAQYKTTVVMGSQATEREQKKMKQNTDTKKS